MMGRISRLQITATPIHDSSLKKKKKTLLSHKLLQLKLKFGIEIIVIVIFIIAVA